jgi:hypothetical protein
MTKHLAFDQLQPIDLSFGLSIAPEADNAVVAHYSDQSESQGMLTLWKDLADTLIATIKEPDDSHHRQPRASVRRQGAIIDPALINLNVKSNIQRHVLDVSEPQDSRQ